MSMLVEQSIRLNLLKVSGHFLLAIAPTYLFFIVWFLADCIYFASKKFNCCQHVACGKELPYYGTCLH